MASATAQPDTPLSPTRFAEDIDGRVSYTVPGQDGNGDDGFSRAGTLRKKNSIGRKQSLGRSASRRSRAGSLSGAGMTGAADRNSVFYTPVPTNSSPTDILVNRFNSWRRILKDFISYFKDVQTSYEARARSMTKITHTLNSASNLPEFSETGGILETNTVLRDFYKESFVNVEGAARIETEIINTLVGLRNDLNLKIKEIKGLSGDFKNNVEKEKEATRKEVVRLQESLTALESNPENASGAKDPYLVRVALEKQLKRLLTEENYLHRAYLNLENSGRELESIVVGEVQKAFDAYVKIVRREGEELFDLSDRLTASTLRLPPDYEWSTFVERDPNMVDPSLPLRTFEDIEYPGSHHPAVVEVRSGLLERKSKYLKSFSPGWFVLSPTYLHEFKSSDRSRDMTPVMSLYLPDSSLGKHSDPHATSHKFMLKGRQTGHLHRGHSWVFRAGSHEEMLAWYEDIRKLTEAPAIERNNFVADVAQRTLSNASRKTDRTEKSEDYSSDNEDGFDNDEADAVPYSADASMLQEPHMSHESVKRPEGGRFPSDIQVNRGLENRNSLSAESTHSVAAVAAAGALPGGEHTEMSPNMGANMYPVGMAERPRSRSSTWSFDPANGQKEVVAANAAIPVESEGHHDSVVSPVRQDYSTREADDPIANSPLSHSQAYVPQTPRTTQPAMPESGPDDQQFQEANALEAQPVPDGPLASNAHPPTSVLPIHEPGADSSTISDYHVPGNYPRPT